MSTCIVKTVELQREKKYTELYLETAIIEKVS